MERFTNEEIEEATKALESSISKCEKARAKLRDGSPQKKWVDRQINAFYIAVSLIKNSHDEEWQLAERWTELELCNSGRTYEMLIGKCESLLAKFKDGSPQRTLAVRRLNAFRIAVALITRELEVVYGKKTP